VTSLLLAFTGSVCYILYQWFGEGGLAVMLILGFIFSVLWYAIMLEMPPAIERRKRKEND
jgi:hypothetical protein